MTIRDANGLAPVVWLVGNEGMLGREVESCLRQRRLPLIATDRELDITDPGAVERQARSVGPAWIVNCAAYTDVERAEDEPDRAGALNEGGAANLARAARLVGARLLQLSTDYVFDGARGNADENAPMGPLNTYGRSKLAGERAVRQALPEHVIVRTAWLYSAGGRNFVRTMLRLFGEREHVRVVSDQYGSPTFAADLAEALVAIVEHPAPRFGSYHGANAGRTSWYTFAVAIYRMARVVGLLRREVAIEPISSAEYPTKAARPVDSSLDSGKLAATFGVALRPWEAALRACIEQIARQEQQP